MIREAKIGDLEAITGIYNQAIEARFQTCFTEPMQVSDRLTWFYQHKADSCPLIVYEAEGKVAGWLSVSPYREGRNALKYTVEISYFIHPHFQRMGIGSALLAHTITQCRELGFKTLLAILIDRNTGSLKLLEKSGFERWGYLPDIAEFDGMSCGHYFYGLRVK